MIRKIPSKIAVTLIKLYQIIFWARIPRCRFLPTCSEYAMEAFNKKGFFNGCYLTCKRILKCHPFGGSGYDPLP